MTGSATLWTSAPPHPNELLEAALAYAARGIAVFPLALGEKIPLISREAGGHGVLDATTDAAQIRAWWSATPHANIGVAAAASGLLLVDLDNKDGRDGYTAWDVLRVQLQLDDMTPQVWTPHNGAHLWFAAPPGIQLRNTNDELGSGIETKSNGTYCVAPPSRLVDGGVYCWDELLNLDTVPIKPVPEALCRLLKPRNGPGAPGGRGRAPALPPDSPARPRIIGGDLATVQDALRRLDPWAGPYDWWVSILMAIHSGYPGADGLGVAEAWADGRDGEVAAKWGSFKADGGITIGSLYHEAERRGWVPPWRNEPDTSGVDAVREPPGWLAEDGHELLYAPRVTTPGPPNRPAIVRPKPAEQRVTGWTAAELLATAFPDPVWAVPDLIPVGLTFLAGRPKVGKSWLALQTAIAVGSGGRVLDKQVTQGNVLYLALEDNGRRLRQRTQKQGMPATAAIRFETAWPRLTDGGIEALDRAIAGQHYSLVVLDTLGRLLGNADQADLAVMTQYVGALQGMAMDHDMAILAIDHHRKPTGYESDPIDDIVGSTAKSAVADAALGLTREQGKRGATLKVVGRDVEWQDLALSWDVVTCCWQYEGTAEEVQLQGRKGDVLDALRANDGPMTLTELVRATELDKGNSAACSQ